MSDFNKNHFQIYTAIEWRIFKGLSVNLSLNYNIVRDQIGLPKGETSRDEVLLSIKQLQTDYSMWANFGISYSFGSIYNNVVNPRFNWNSCDIEKIKLKKDYLFPQDLLIIPATSTLPSSNDLFQSSHAPFLSFNLNFAFPLK